MAAKPQVPVKKSNTSVAQPALDALYEQYAGSGLEQADRDSYVMPFLIVLQKGSPQVDPADGAYIEGAKPGQFLNTVTGTLYDNVTVTPVHFERRFVRWAPRNAGGGFKGQFLPEDDLVKRTPMGEDGQRRLENGDMLRDTRLHYCLIAENEDVSPVLINMASTQVKKSRNWCSKMDQQKFKLNTGEIKTKPTFSTLYRLNTVLEQNDKGKWFGYTVELLGPTPEPVFRAAVAFKEALARGAVKADFASAADHEQPAETRF